MMKTIIHLPFLTEAEAPPSDSGEDRLPESLVRWALEHYTKAGDKVLDPFFGLGSAITQAANMDRIPYGIEADQERFEWVAGQSEHWMNLACIDAYDIAQAGFPKMDACLTSPPFMAKTHKWNPLYGGDPNFAGYERYIERIAEIFAQMATRMKRGAPVMVHVDNIDGRIFTPLVRDMGAALAQSFTQIGESVIIWDTAQQDHPVMEEAVSRLLIFKKA